MTRAYINVSFDPEEARRIRVWAAQHGVTASEWIRQAALAALDHKLGKVECGHPHVVRGVCWSCWEFVGDR